MNRSFELRQRSLLRRIFPDRQILIRTGEQISTIRLRPGLQMAGLAAFLMFGGALAASSVGLWQSEKIRVSEQQRVLELSVAVDALMRELGRTVGQVQGLRDEVSARDEKIQQLALHNHELSEKLTIADRRTQILRKNLASVERSRRIGLEMGQGFVASTDSIFDQLNTRTTVALNELERAIGFIGIDVDRLLAADEVRANVGGPYVPSLTANGLQDAAAVRLNQSLMRIAGLQAVLQRLPLSEPTRVGQVSSGFGQRTDPFTRKPALHTGLDVSAPHGTPVYATGPGRVASAGFAGPYGRLVEINHGLGLRTRYAHLHRLHVKPGDRVTAGTLIGTVGSSGRSTGPHLHYEVIYRESPLDPLNFIEAGKSIALTLSNDDAALEKASLGTTLPGGRELSEARRN
ncbi:MAG: M23 family metallopeptidase [Alphaproteobacteria bacterium]|nr:M23 family metallopeptidase [Alphaproteobacteria bacterium]